MLQQKDCSGFLPRIVRQSSVILNDASKLKRIGVLPGTLSHRDEIENAKKRKRNDSLGK